MNAISRPYSGITHDARLYSLQALNQAEDGAYADDVFLRYGSQDQFSLFSRIVGPIVAALGLRLTFFLFYLVFNTLIIVALFRLVRALIEDPLISTLALVYLVSAPLSYGACDIFMVHEQFFTPRIIGSALTLFALERLLRGHFATAIALLGAGTLMHPLMAFGGIMIATCFVACTYFSPRVFIGLFATALLLGALILGIPALGTFFFGSMDDHWHHLIRLAVGYNYHDSWPLKDWLNLAISFALPISACFYLYPLQPSAGAGDGENSVRRRFLVAVTLAGAVGFLATVVAPLLSYALLFQAQPYRVLWILKALQVPLGFLLIARWSQSPVIYAKLAALALVGFFCVIHSDTQELFTITMALLISFLLSRMGNETAHAGWWWYAVARGFVLGAVGWMFYRWGFFLTWREVYVANFDLTELVLLFRVSPILCIVALCGTARFWETAPSFARLRSGAVAVALLTPISLFATGASPTFRRDHTRLGSDIAFVRDFIHERAATHGRYPNIYCSLGRPDLLWIDVQATSYFDILQTAGVMFQRATALEIDRRIALVNKFEMARQRERAIFVDDAQKLGLENLFKLSFDCPAPSQDDLVLLCREPGLDYVVIPQEFPDLYPATNGRIFVYECHKVRMASSFSVRTTSRER